MNDGWPRTMITGEYTTRFDCYGKPYASPLTEKSFKSSSFNADRARHCCWSPVSYIAFIVQLRRKVLPESHPVLIPWGWQGAGFRGSPTEDQKVFFLQLKTTEHNTTQHNLTTWTLEGKYCRFKYFSSQVDRRIFSWNRYGKGCCS